jgi:glycosyltransferase involved in cell wall biosynthesis
MLLRSRRPDVCISILEGQGYLHSVLKSCGARPWADVPLVLVSCWLAEQARLATAAQLRRLRAAVAGADLVVYWSRNQAKIYEERLRVPRERLFFVPFGIETEFYRPAPDCPREGYVLSAGRDDGRDWSTLLAAAAEVDCPVKVVCPPRSVAGLPVAPNVDLLGEVDAVEYRQLLWRATAVALASRTECAYPTGQTLLLNAMAVGTPTITTATHPLADYTRAGENTWLVEPSDPRALADGIVRVMTDRRLAERISSGGLADVAKTFNARAMWHAVAEQMRELVRRPSRRRLAER